ncbi:MAG: hypothetical protein EBX76_05330 [Acidimicrobiia bacterium]|nr:hypothetical protein [Acidimicrobiia bacterium]
MRAMRQFAVDIACQFRAGFPSGPQQKQLSQNRMARGYSPRPSQTFQNAAKQLAKFLTESLILAQDE